MGKKVFSWDAFNKVPIVGIVRNLSLEQVKNILPVYVDAGLSTIEITMNTKGAGEIIQYISSHYSKLNAGAGTVCTEKDLQLALDAGSQFIVTPIMNKKLIRTCVKKKIPVFAGAFTPTEIFRTWSLGASMVKVYPAKALGAGYIKDIKAPLDQIKLLATGGIGLEDIDAYRRAGADGFGIGTPLFNKELIEQKNLKGLLEHFLRFAGKLQTTV